MNCSGFIDSVLLPDDLESRFRRLKSIPDTKSPSSSSKEKQFGHPVKNRVSGLDSSASSGGDEQRIFSGNKRNPGGKFGDTKNSSSVSDSRVFSGNRRNPGEKSGLRKNPRSGFPPDGFRDSSDSGKIGSSSSNSSRERKIFSPAKQTQKPPNEKPRIRSDSSPPSSDPDNPEHKTRSKPSSNSWSNLLSPSKSLGCIMWRSPNKSSDNKTTKKKSSKSLDRDKAVDFDGFLSDLGKLSVEEQRKLLKKAIKEQQKMRREAAEIIRTAKKQTSSRFDFDD